MYRSKRYQSLTHFTKPSASLSPTDCSEETPTECASDQIVERMQRGYCDNAIFEG